jgi:hypothetical protein
MGVLIGRGLFGRGDVVGWKWISFRLWIGRVRV